MFNLKIASQRVCCRKIVRTLSSGVQNGNTTKKIAGPPQFAGLLRQFYKLSHPDLLRASNSQLADINDQSWQTLNNVLSTIKTVNTYPPRMKRSIPFYIRSKDAESGYKPIILTISTGGGDCKKQFGATMRKFFVDAGISKDGMFSWGKEYFPTEVYGKKVDEEEL